MSRIKPVLLTVLRLTNAALLAAALVMAVRSYWVQDFLRLPSTALTPAAWVKSGGGELLLQVFPYRHTPHRTMEWRRIEVHRAAFLSDDVEYHGFGFGFDADPHWPTIVLPWWAIAAPLAVWPIWWLLWDRMRWRRAMRGLCVGCGYDLRETAGASCPECGCPVSAKASRIAFGR